jgi:hypothetical protein
MQIGLLSELGLELPPVPTPAADYANAVLRRAACPLRDRSR